MPRLARLEDEDLADAHVRFAAEGSEGVLRAEALTSVQRVALAKFILRSEVAER